MAAARCPYVLANPVAGGSQQGRPGRSRRAETSGNDCLDPRHGEQSGEGGRRVFFLGDWKVLKREEAER